jgi:hypothetical protein
MVDDTVGIHTVRLSQSTLAGYLEQAFVAGERAEFDRLDKKARAREDRKSANSVIRLMEDAANSSDDEESTDWQPPFAQEADSL